MIFKVIIQLNCENESLHIFCSHIMFKLKQLNIFIHNNTERGGGGDYHLALKIKLTVTFRHTFYSYYCEDNLEVVCIFLLLLRHPVEFY